MSLWKIAWRSIQQRALASSLTGISMALGVMLVVAVLVVHGVVNQSFLNNSGLGYNMVVGAKGGRLELVLNTVYYLARPVENIPYTYYLEFTEGKFKDYVDKAMPLCLGDMYQDFRVDRHHAGIVQRPGLRRQEVRIRRGTELRARRILRRRDRRDRGPRNRARTSAASSSPPTAPAPTPTSTIRSRCWACSSRPARRTIAALFINMEGFYLIPEHAKPLDEAGPGRRGCAGQGRSPPRACRGGRSAPGGR